MASFIPQVNEERWRTLTKKEQLLHIASELSRAYHLALASDKENVANAYEQALAMIDTSLADPKWRGNYSDLLGIREAIAALYAGEFHPIFPRLLHENLMRLSGEAA